MLLPCVALLLFATRALSAQQTPESAITVSAGFSTDRYVGAQEAIALTLSRPPAASEGRIAVFVGTSDLTSLFEVVGAKLVYRSNGVDLPAGASDLKVFLVSGSAWHELASIPMRVLTPRGFEKALIDPSIELRNTGQLREGLIGTQAASARPTYQNVAGTLSLQTTHERAGFSLTSDAHALGANERKDALRFGEKGDLASRIDLADYVVRFRHRNTVLALGQVSAGMNRHLINGFASRGITAAGGGSRFSWSVGAENGSNIVGTDNIIGLDRSEHRVLSTGLALEMLPARPGALHLDATLLHGSVLATPGFNQNGIISADQSDGYGLQVAASTPSQRVRVAAGLASSRSEYAADPPLSSSGSSVPSLAHRKNARYAELYFGILQNHKLLGAVQTTLDTSLRHERVDPLYRTVATYVQSDIQRDGVDVGGSLDAITVRVSAGRTTDNLNDIASLLTTRSRSSALTLATPLAALLRVTRGASWLPTLSYARQQLHQAGAGIPIGFSAADIPDQLSVVHDASAQWQVKQWQFAYHVNLSDQDNQQPGYEQADFGALTHGVNVGVMVGNALSLGFDLGLERQENKQFALVNRVRRAGVTSNWRPTSLTTLDGAFSLSRAEDPGAGSNTHIASTQAGISQGFNLWHSSNQASGGQVFLRFSRYSNDVFNLGSSFGPTLSMGTWRLASGLTLRLF